LQRFRPVEAALLPDDVDVRLLLDRAAQLERDRRGRCLRFTSSVATSTHKQTRPQIDSIRAASVLQNEPSAGHLETRHNPT
jgi:hypothetical protein